MTNELINAINESNIEKVREYLEEYKDPNVTDSSSGKTAVQLAAERKQFDIVQLLLDNGAKYHPILNGTRLHRNPLLMAILEKDIKAVQTYLNGRRSLEYANAALRLAEDRDQHEIVNLLLKHREIEYKPYFDYDYRLDSETFTNITPTALNITLMSALPSLIFGLVGFTTVFALCLTITTVAFATFIGSCVYTARLKYHKRFSPIDSVNRFDLNECFNHVDLRFSANTTESFSQDKKRVLTDMAIIINAYLGNTAEVKLLLAAKADINAKDKDGKTALMYAVHSKNVEMVTLLLDRGADIYAKDRHGRTALMYAVSNDDIEMAKVLIDKGAGISAKNNYDDTALMIAAYKGYTHIVTLLLKEGAKPDPINVSRYSATALLLAVSGGHLNTVRVLLENGAQVDIANRHGKTPLMIAKHKGYGDIVELLTKYEGLGKRNQSLMIAAARGDIAKVEQLLTAGADVNAKNKYGETALLFAAYKGYMQVVKLLIDNGADVNAKDIDGDTALMIAADKGFTQVIKPLIDNGADVNAKNIDGDTALIIAADKGFKNGFTQVVKLLIDNRADVNAKNKDGNTAIMIAAHKGFTQVVKLLIDNGADVNAKNKDGDTAIMIAKQKEYENVVELLTEKLTQNVGLANNSQPLSSAELPKPPTTPPSSRQNAGDPPPPYWQVVGLTQ